MLIRIYPSSFLNAITRNGFHLRVDTGLKIVLCENSTKWTKIVPSASKKWRWFKRVVRSQAGVGPLRSQGNSSSPRSFAVRFLRLKHFPLSRSNCPCIFEFLHSLLLSLLSHLTTRFCPADLQLPRPSNFSHSSHKLQASFLCSRANTNTMIAIVRGNKLLQEKLSSGEYFRPNLGQDSQI